ncbi:hypothetical protein SAMN04488588_2098 [Geotoga petraea]|jgi:hypothetical protein|uniref:Uncharacterized protein n=2 Tax=Geotoga petraea TaxID=28234 RepID=A0A1G6QJ59_9BACT|nr:hypothetical protein [Geotoga petraea]MDK2946284.1 hypothetical protein [Geotoga sp.]SDC92419.1 hypothetical protein SAMN04488588_2098 [Geotoga petraea]
MMFVEFDVDFIKQIINNIVKKSNGELLGFLMGSSVKFQVQNNKFIIKVLFLKYRVEIEKIPKKASEEFVFTHNLPLEKMDKSQLPSFVRFEKNKIYLRLPKNFITDNLIISDFKMEDDRIYIELK